MTRAPLPDRRMNVTEAVTHRDHAWKICIGFDRAGKVREIFADPVSAKVKPDSERKREIEDTMILVSHVLQSGQDILELQRRFARPDEQPLTLMEAIIRKAAELEEVAGPHLAEVQGYGKPDPGTIEEAGA